MKLIICLIAVVALREVQCIEELKDIVVEDSFEDYYDSSDYWDSLESDISNSGPSPDIAATNTVETGEEKFPSDYFDDYVDEDYDGEDEEDRMASLWDNPDSITEQLESDESSAENESFTSTSDALSTWSYSKYLKDRELERSLRVRQLIYILAVCGCVLLALLFMLLALHLRKIAKAQKATSLYYILYEEA